MDEDVVVEWVLGLVTQCVADDVVGHWQHYVLDIVLKENSVGWGLAGQGSQVIVEVLKVIEVIVETYSRR